MRENQIDLAFHVRWFLNKDSYSAREGNLTEIAAVTLAKGYAVYRIA